LETVQTNEANKTRDAQQEQSHLAQTSTRSLSSAEVEGIAEFEDERDITKRNRKLADNQPEEQAENGKKEESREKEAENREQQKARKENQASQKDKALAVAGGKQPFQLPGPFSAKKRIPFPFTPKGKKGKGGKEEGEERTVENKAAAFAPLSKQTAPAAKKNNEAAPSKAEAFSPAPDAAASTPQVKAEPPAQSTQTEQVANDYLKAPLSQKVTRMNAIGSSFGKAFNADRGAVAKKTRVKASLEDNSGPPPPPPQVVKTQAPQLTEWKEPDRKAKKDDSTKVDTSGDANPSQVDAQAKADQAKAQGQQETAAKDISGLPGPEKIEGASVEMSPQLEVPDATTVPQARISPQMQNYMSMPLASFRPKVDEAAQQAWESDVAEARNTISENIQKRDEEQSKAVTETQQEAAKLETEAQQKQDAAIASSRTAIQEEKEKGMAESQAQLDEYRAKAGAERDKHLTDIENRIQKDEGRAQDELDKADKEVAKEKKKADKEKKKEEEKAEKKKKKRSFWQKIGDFFSNIAKALKKVVTAIVDTLKKVVKGIIEAARKLVNGIIEMARQFIVNAIKAFASVVKGFLEVALAAFPGIRDAVIGAIDDIVNATVEGINKAAQFLKDSVNSLVDKLNQYIDFISNFFESLIEGGFAMLQAILTGNFDQLPKIAFMTACNALGLPGEEFWKILMKAKDQALNIIKNPVGFLKNLIASGKKGFMKFMKNFGKHLQKGLMGWLFGQLGAAGVTLPKKFDLPNMFNFIRKILGFTLEYVEERIIMHVGQENIDKAKKVIDFFRKLFTEGPIALWNMFKAKLGDIRKLVMEQIQQFIVVQIVQKAVAKVISMLIPGGGFLQAILAAYQTLMFFIQNIKQIASLVNSILDSLASITRGAIGKAANYIESVMAKSLPLIFRFLAKLIGIGGIGARIAKIIEKLRTPVNKSIDNTVGKAVSGVKSGYGKAKAGAKKGWAAAKASGKKGFQAAKKGGLKAGLKSVKSDAQEAKENAKATYHQKKEEAKAKYQETKEKATDKYKAAKSEAKSGFKGTRTAVKAKVEAKKAQAKEKYDEVKGKAQAGIDTIKSKIPKLHKTVKVFGKAKTPETAEIFADAMVDLNALAQTMEGEKPLTEEGFKSSLKRLKGLYSFKKLEGGFKEGRWYFEGSLNPDTKGSGEAGASSASSSASGSDYYTPQRLQEMYTHWKEKADNKDNSLKEVAKLLDSKKVKSKLKGKAKAKGKGDSISSDDYIYPDATQLAAIKDLLNRFGDRDTREDQVFTVEILSGDCRELLEKAKRVGNGKIIDVLEKIRIKLEAVNPSDTKKLNQLSLELQDLSIKVNNFSGAQGLEKKIRDFIARGMKIKKDTADDSRTEGAGPAEKSSSEGTTSEHRLVELEEDVDESSTSTTSTSTSTSKYVALEDDTIELESDEDYEDQEDEDLKEKELKLDELESKARKWIGKKNKKQQEVLFFALDLGMGELRKFEGKGKLGALKRVIKKAGATGIASWLLSIIMPPILARMDSSIDEMMPMTTTRKMGSRVARGAEGAGNVVLSGLSATGKLASLGTGTVPIAATAASASGAMAAGHAKVEGMSKEKAAVVGSVTALLNFLQGLIPIYGDVVGVVAGAKDMGKASGVKRLYRKLRGKDYGRPGGFGQGDESVVDILEERIIEGQDLQREAESAQFKNISKEYAKLFKQLANLVAEYKGKKKKAEKIFAKKGGKGKRGLKNAVDKD
jgi:hypothetical protein